MTGLLLAGLCIAAALTTIALISRRRENRRIEQDRRRSAEDRERERAERAERRARLGLDDVDDEARR